MKEPRRHMIPDFTNLKAHHMEEFDFFWCGVRNQNYKLVLEVIERVSLMTLLMTVTDVMSARE